jgi:hypothetical protein
MANIPRVLLLRTNESASPRMSVNGTKQTYGSGAMQSAQERKADCPRFHVKAPTWLLRILPAFTSGSGLSTTAHVTRIQHRSELLQRSSEIPP